VTVVTFKSIQSAKSGRNDLSAIWRKGVFCIDPAPSSVRWLGNIRVHGEFKGYWRVGVDMSTHILYAAADDERGSLLEEKYVLRDGKNGRLIADVSGLRVEVFKHFEAMKSENIADGMLMQTLTGIKPAYYCDALDYAEFHLRGKASVDILPAVCGWQVFDIAGGVRELKIGEGAKWIYLHVSGAAGMGIEVELPDSAVACKVALKDGIKLSIGKRLAANWAYWSVVAGRMYSIEKGFAQTPDGCVRVRDKALYVVT
jgi:hypothetical protein